MLKYFMSITFTFIICLFLIGCADTESNQRDEYVPNQKEVEVFDEEHLIIEENMEEEIGFVPDTATVFNAKDSYEQKVMIEGEEAVYYKIPTKERYFNFNYIIDTLKKSEEDSAMRNFRIFVYKNKELSDFWVNNKSQKYFDVEMPNNSSINIPISVKIDSQNDYSDILVVLINKDMQYHIEDHMNASKILISRQEIKDNIEGYTKKDVDNNNLKLRSEKSKSEEEQFGDIELLNKDGDKAYRISKTKYIKLGQVPEDIIQEVIVFDIEGNIYPLSRKQQEAITIKRENNEDIIIPYNHKNKDDIRLFLLINNNPNQLAFKHLNELKNHEVEQWQNYSTIIEIGVPQS